MTGLVPYSEFELEQTWKSITEWLDTVFANTVSSHRRLGALEDDLELLEQELFDMDRFLPQSLSPVDTIAAAALGMRLRDMDTVIYSKWTSEPVRQSALRALRGIHLRYLGAIPDSRRHLVVFEISNMFRNRDLFGFVESHRLEKDARWAHTGTSGRTRILRAVEGPLWVHDLYSHLLGESLRGAKLRERYVTRVDGTGRAYWSQELSGTNFVGPPIRRPDEDVLDTALRLWDPETAESPYQELSDAVQAAVLL